MFHCPVSAVPDYATIEGITTYNISTSSITGRSLVTFTYNVTSHWSSLAVIETVYGLLTRESNSGISVFDPKNRHFTRHLDVIVSALCIQYTWYSVYICINS